MDPSECGPGKVVVNLKGKPNKKSRRRVPAKPFQRAGRSSPTKCRSGGNGVETSEAGRAGRERRPRRDRRPYLPGAAI